MNENDEVFLVSADDQKGGVPSLWIIGSDGQKCDVGYGCFDGPFVVIVIRVFHGVDPLV